MRVVFMGAPDFAVPALKALVDLKAEIVAVYSKAPRPAGRRGLELTKTRVHAYAESLGLRVLTPSTLRTSEAQAEFRNFRADIAVVAAYGLILPASVLEAPRLGCVNLHASLLPRWRGAAPIQRAIMAGDAATGVDLMRMEEGLDTGPVGGEARVEIRPEDTAGDLTGALATVGGRLLTESWDELVSGRLVFHAQSVEGVVYAHKIEKSETPIDWTEDARTVRNRIHGLSPFPGAHSEILRGDKTERVKFLRVEVVEASGEPGAVLDDVLTVGCGKGAIRAVLAQRAGKSPMSGRDLMRGDAIRIGHRFTRAASPQSAS